MGMRFDFIIGLPLLPVSFGSFLMSLAVDFQVGFGLFK